MNEIGGNEMSSPEVNSSEVSADTGTNQGDVKEVEAITDISEGHPVVR